MNRYAHALFCDDVRQEANGKSILIGIYTGTMLVPSFPFSMPKLMVAMLAATPIDQPFKTIKFRVFQDQEQLVEIEVPPADLETYQDTPQFPPSTKFRQIQTLAVASPIVFVKESILSVTVEIDGVAYDAPGLWVTESPPERINQ